MAMEGKAVAKVILEAELDLLPGGIHSRSHSSSPTFLVAERLLESECAGS